MNRRGEGTGPKENRMNRALCVWLGLGVMVAGPMAGCGPVVREQTAGSEPAATSRNTAAVRLEALRQRGESLAGHARHLPGGTDLEHRFIMSDVLGAAAAAIRMLSENGRTGALEQQLAILESVRVRLSAADINVNTDALIDTGLRAAVSALAGIRGERFSDDPALRSAGERLQAKVQELDMVRGPMHRLVATETVNLMAQSIGRMITVLEERIAPPPLAAPADSTPAPPAEPPASPEAPAAQGEGESAGPQP